MAGIYEGRRVLVCVCGGIAAYKAVEIVRLLQKQGCVVRVVSTEDGLRFVGEATWEGITREHMVTSLYDAPDSTIPHIALAEWAEAVLVVPATANVMAKMVAGIADEVVSTTLLAIDAMTPVVVAPAMNTNMWLSHATRHNVALLEKRGVRMVTPVSGRLACDAVGEGKLASVEVIADAVLDALGAASATPGALEGRTVLITAGPTHEAIDPVRYIANSSSGKMGYAIAAEACARGARVVLVSGPVALETPTGVERVDVVSASQMYDAAVTAFYDADVAICSAAVADYTPAHPADHKLKKNEERLEYIELVQTKDILAELGQLINEGGRRRVLVGFAAETNNLLRNAQAKLAKKGCDLVVANDVSRTDSGFGADTNRVSFVTPQEVRELPTLTKQEVARRLLDVVEDILEVNARD